jgi:hypothetical protein
MSLHDIAQQIAELTRRVTELEAYRSSVETDRTPTYTSNVTAAPAHSLPGRDSVRQKTKSSPLTETLGVAETSKVGIASANYSKRQ